MRLIASVCVTAVLTALAAPSTASAAWSELVGGPSPINQAADKDAEGVHLTSLGGTPYVTWSELDGLSREVRVSRLNQAGTAFEQLVGGPSPINRSSALNGREPSIAAINGRPHVAWYEPGGGGGGGFQIRVSRLNAAETDWEELVGGASPINRLSSATAISPSLVGFEGTPYVAWQESDGTKYQVRVSRLNAAETDWEEVVGGASPINFASNQNANAPSLAVIGGALHVAWIEEDGTNTEVRVSRLNAAGTDWEELVGGASPINRSSSANASSPSLIGIENTPYVAWTEDDGSNNEVRVSRLNAAGTDWEEVVGGASPINHANTGGASSVSLTQLGGTPYVSWIEDEGGVVQARASRLNAAGTEWEELVGGESPINASSTSSAKDQSMVFIGRTPYLAWSETDGVNDELRMARLEPDILASQALATDTGAYLIARAKTYGTTATMGFDYGAGGTLSQRTAPLIAGGLTGEDTITTQIDGLVPSTAYLLRPFATDGIRFLGSAPTSTFTTRAAPQPITNTVTIPATPPASTSPAVTAPELLAALVNPALRAKRGRSVKIGYLATVAGQAQLEIRRGATRVARLTGAAKVGRNSITWNGRLAGKLARTGSYRLVLTVTSAGGRTASDAGTVRITRR